MITPTPIPATTSPTRRKSIRTAMLTQSIVLIAFAVAVLSLLSILVLRSFLIHRTFDQLSSVVASKEHLISTRLEQSWETTNDLVLKIEKVPEQQRENTLTELREALGTQNISVSGIALFDATKTVIHAVGSPLLEPITLPTETYQVPTLGKRHEWNGSVAYAPLHASGGAIVGALGVRYDATPLFSALAQMDGSPIDTTLWILQKEGKHTNVLFASQYENQTVGRDALPHGQNFARSILDTSGIYSGKNDFGEEIIASYANIPSLGWEIVAITSSAYVLSGVQTYAVTLLAIDFFLVLLATVFSSSLSRQLSSPILRLSEAMRKLRPGHWTLERSVFTGDEVEVLDTVAADLSARLRTTYEHLEEEVAARTAELKQQYLLDRTILENISYGVFVMDTEGTVTEANPAACKLLMLERSDILGKQEQDLFHFFLKGKPVTDEHPIRAMLDTKEHLERRMHLKQNDGSLLPIAVSVMPLSQVDTSTGSIAIVQDLREQNHIDEMKSEFISLASHQLRTPLSSVRWYLELLSTDTDAHFTDDQRSFLDQIDHAAKRMAELLDELMRIAHLEDGQIRTEWKTFDIAQWLRQISEEFEPIAAKRGLTSTLSIPDEEITISSDPVLLHIVLQNFFTNAAKYSPTNTTVRLELKQQGEMLSIAVTDNGMGIPSEDQPHIFEKFFRAKNAKKSVVEGTGLGLYLSKMIIENLGGSLSFVSVPEKGTTFTMQLPMKRKETPEKKS